MDWMNKLAEAKYPIILPDRKKGIKGDCRLTVRQKEGLREAYIQRLRAMLETMSEDEIIKLETKL